MTRILEEVEKDRQTRMAHEAEDGPGGKNLKLKVERFFWLIEDMETRLVRKSKVLFLTMRNCLIEAGKEILTSAERLNYKTSDLFVNEMVLIQEVFLYLVKLEYKDLTQKKCQACRNGTNVHEIFCFQAETFSLSDEICARAVLKMSAKRLMDSLFKICSLYGLPKNVFTLRKAEMFIDQFDKYDYHQIIEKEFDFEMNILDD